MKSCDESAQIEALKRKSEGLTDSFAPEMPIIGVPAKYLLAMLDANSK